MKNLFFLALAGVLFTGCSNRITPENELYGVVNSKTVRGKDIHSRLNVALKELEKANPEEKRKYFDLVAEQIVIEDEAKKFGGDKEKLTRIFSLFSQIPVSKEEKVRFEKAHSDLGISSGASLDEKIRADRLVQLQEKYHQELRKRSTIKFLLGQDHRSRILGLKD